MNAIMKFVCIAVLLLGSSLAQAADPKPVEWKGSVDAIDVKAKTFAMLVVGKNVPENGKVVILKLTDATKFVWRTEDAKKFLDAKPDDVKRGQHIVVLKTEAGEVLEIRLPVMKITE